MRKEKIQASWRYHTEISEKVARRCSRRFFRPF